MQNPKFQMYKSAANGDFYFRLRATNGETILSGEGYKSKQGCLDGIASVKENAPHDNRYYRRNSPTFSFNLHAANGEIIGRGEPYTNNVNREIGISAVKRDAPNARIEDNP